MTAIGFVILTLARACFPRTGTATLIASFAMLYKFLNAPFFACHLLGIVLMGVCYDVFFNVFKIRAAWLAAGLATYVNYAAFALMVTYVARYNHWVQGGFSKVLEHVGIAGSLAAIACAILVPLTLRYSEKFRAPLRTLFAWRAAPQRRYASALAPGAVMVFTAGLWVLGVITCVLNHAPRT